MSSDEVAAIRRDLNALQDEVHEWGKKIDRMHRAVVKMSSKVYVPGPPQADGQKPTT